LPGALPPSAVCQIVRIAERLAAEYSEVTAEVANAVSRTLHPQSSCRLAVAKIIPVMGYRPRLTRIRLIS
jgi:hypothetical protein